MNEQEKEASPQPVVKKARTDQPNSRLDVNQSVLTELLGWRAPSTRDIDISQWTLFRNHFWANSSVDVSAGETLDLSQWKSALKLLQLSRYRLFVRQEYADFYNPLVDASKLSLSFRVIMGSPGIGKRVFLLYILIRRLIAAQATVLVLGNVPMLFRFDGTYRLIKPTEEYDPFYVIDSESPSLRTWILVVTSRTSTLPAPRLTDTTYGFPILTSSPDEQCYRSLVTHDPNTYVWVMQVWNEQELMAFVSSVLDLGDGARAKTMSLIEQYGPCIRDIFKVNRSPNAVLQPMEQALGTIDNAKTLLVIVTNAAQAPSTHVFHQLFVIRRARSVGDLALCDNHLYAVDVKSRTVFVSLMQTHLRLSLHSAKVIFTLARSSDIEFNSLAVWAFEKITNHYLASGSGRNGRRASLIFCAQMKALNDSHFFHCSWDAPDDELVVSSWAVRVEASNNQPKSISLKHELPLSPRDIIHYHELPRQFSNDKYYIPVQKNNPFFDAFFISAGDTGKSILWVVQTTMAAQHGGSEDGYSIIETIRERLGGDCAVKYVLLVPWQKQRAYRWEMPNGGHKGEVYIQYVDMDASGLWQFD